MPRQVTGNHSKALLKRPLDDMSVESGVIVEAVEDKQRRLHPFRPPDLADHFITVDLKTPQATAYVARRKIQPVKPLIGLCLH
ncbi:hypothetical protein D3C76_1676900 [compost metagenome]